MSAPQHGSGRVPTRWPWAVGVGLAAGLLLVWGFHLRATEGEGKPAEKGKGDAPAKPPEKAVAPPQPGLTGQFELMEEMLKAMKNPAGPAPEDLQRILQKAAALLEPGQFDQFAGANGGDTGYISQRLGLQTKPPGDDLVEQLDLPRGQGQVVLRVVPDSAAAEAGLKPSDILLELNDKAVSRTPAEFVRALEGIKSEVPVNAVVLRKGVKKEIKGLKLREAPPPAVLPRFPPLNLPQPGPRGPALPGRPVPGARFARPVGIDADARE